MGNIVLLDLVGGIALLLWGLHMVQSGILRAFGADLRRILGVALRNKATAFLAGIGVTALLQSSTATGLMTATFVGDGLVGLVPALAIMLGANVGTTLIVQLFSFDVSWVAPILLVVGVVGFKRSTRTVVRDLGRVAIGLGLMLLSLHILLDTLAPAENAPGVKTMLAATTTMPVLNVVFGAVLAWAAHSSVAVVLLVDVARLFELHHARGGARAGARRQSRQRHQSVDRRRRPCQPDRAPAAARQPDQPRRRLRAGAAVACTRLPTR